MSKSYKGEDRRAAAQAHRARRTARLDKFLESHDSSLESKTHARNVPTHPVDASPSAKQRWTVGWRG